jgi:hypothetical protein
MPALTLLAALQPDFPCALDDLVRTETQADLTLTTLAPAPPCPQCRTVSRRVHSRYTRTLWDVPLGSRLVCLHLRLRKFFCDNPDCPQAIFAERLVPWLAPYARRTQRLQQDLTAVACENGGQGGSRLAARLRLGHWSPNTLLRLVPCAANDAGHSAACGDVAHVARLHG